MTENDRLTLELLEELRTATPETRDAWRAKALEEAPQDAEFIEAAYHAARSLDNDPKTAANVETLYKAIAE